MKESHIYPLWPVKITGGHVEFEDRAAFYEHLIPYEGKEMALILKRRVKDRSRQEEKYYHAVVVRMVAEEMDTTREDAHDFLRKMFLTTEEKQGKYRYVRVMSTTELSDGAYRDYWEKCVRWAALPTYDDGLSEDSGLNLYIPYPNEVSYENCY